MRPTSRSVTIRIRKAVKGQFAVDTGCQVKRHGTIRFKNSTKHKVFVQISHDRAIKGGDFAVGPNSIKDVAATGYPGYYVFSVFVLDERHGGGQFARACSMPIIIIKP